MTFESIGELELDDEEYELKVRTWGAVQPGGGGIIIRKRRGDDVRKVAINYDETENLVEYLRSHDRLPLLKEGR